MEWGRVWMLPPGIVQEQEMSQRRGRGREWLRVRE